MVLPSLIRFGASNEGTSSEGSVSRIISRSFMPICSPKTFITEEKLISWVDWAVKPQHKEKKLIWLLSPVMYSLD